MKNDPGLVASNVEAAHRIFSEYGGFLHTLIRSLISNKDMVEDIYHDFFLFLVRKPLPEDVDNIRAYVGRAATHFVFRVQRKSARRKACIQGYFQRFGAKIFEQNVNNTTPLDAIATEEQYMRMLELIESTLPAVEATAIRRQYRGGESRKTIAKAMSLKPGTVSTYVSIGLKKMRMSLRDAESE